jgi:hypothetical protein
MPTERRKELIQQIQEKRASHVICCITSDRPGAEGVIAKDFLLRFFEHLRKLERRLLKLDVFLCTLGGDTLAAYALSRFLRGFAEQIGVLVPYWCHSAGTLFALGADEIVMTRVATLSAIDPSITGPLSPLVEPQPGQRIPVPVGVESVAGFKNTVRDDWGLSEEGAGAAFRLLVERVHPLLLGDLYRSREQIIRLATNLMKLHRKDDDTIRRVVETLATRLGSHDYMIGAIEARNLLEPQILGEDLELEELLWELYSDFAREMELGINLNPAVEIQAAASKGQALPLKKALKVVWIESLARKDVWERELVMGPGQVQTIRDGWA